MIIAPLNQQQHLEITACGRQFAQIRVVSRSRRRLSSRVAIKALLFPALSRWIYRTCTGIQEGQLSFSLVTLLLHFSAALPTKALGGAALRLCIWVFVLIDRASLDLHGANQLCCLFPEKKQHIQKAFYYSHNINLHILQPLLLHNSLSGCAKRVCILSLRLVKNKTRMNEWVYIVYTHFACEWSLL
jgi:hypothetical protein